MTSVIVASGEYRAASAARGTFEEQTHAQALSAAGWRIQTWCQYQRRGDYSMPLGPFLVPYEIQETDTGCCYGDVTPETRRLDGLIEGKEE